SQDRFPSIAPVSTFKMSLSPRVNSDSTITLTMDPQVDYVGATNLGPTSSSTNATLTRTLHDGETMVLWAVSPEEPKRRHGYALIPYGVNPPANTNVPYHDLLIFIRPSIQK